MRKPATRWSSPRGPMKRKTRSSLHLATNVQIHGDPSGPKPKISAALAALVLTHRDRGQPQLCRYRKQCQRRRRRSLLQLKAGENRCEGGQHRHLRRLRLCRLHDPQQPLPGRRWWLDRSPGCGMAPNTAASVRNVTAIASGSVSVGVSAEYNEVLEGSFSLDLPNSIARGDGSGPEIDGRSKSVGHIVVNHSNFHSPIRRRRCESHRRVGNQSAPPLFVDPSRTCHGGGLTDNRRRHRRANLLAGPRRQSARPGPGPDMGADETSNRARVAAVAEPQL